MKTHKFKLRDRVQYYDQTAIVVGIYDDKDIWSDYKIKMESGGNRYVQEHQLKEPPKTVELYRLTVKEKSGLVWQTEWATSHDVLVEDGIVVKTDTKVIELDS